MDQKNKFEEFACQFKNEAFCEEEMEEEGLDFNEESRAYFEEDRPYDML